MKVWLRWLIGRWELCLGVFLALATVGLTLWIGFADGKDPKVFAVLAVVGQFGSAFLFAQHRKPGSAHAKTIVRQLIDMRTRLAGLVRYVEAVQEKQPKASPTELREALGKVNVETSYLADGCVRVVESWGDFDPGTLLNLEWVLDPTPDSGTPNGEGA